MTITLEKIVHMLNLDIRYRHPTPAEIAGGQQATTKDMFVATVQSPNLVQEPQTGGTLHESPVFHLNGRRCKLKYSYTPSQTSASIGTAKVQIVSPDGGTISTNTCTFATNPESTGPELVIGRRFDTEEAFRGNGFGSAVALLTNELIQHTMATQPELQGKRAISMLFDETQNGWSSRQAEQLGFQQVGYRIWVKEYQG